MNGTVLKIFGRQFTGTDGTGVLISALWPYGGEDAEGRGLYLNGIHEEPLEFYYLVRKDVVEGAVLEMPETSGTATLSAKSSGTYTRVAR